MDLPPIWGQIHHGLRLRPPEKGACAPAEAGAHGLPVPLADLGRRQSEPRERLGRLPGGDA